MTQDRYSNKCVNCPNWKFQCWVLAPGTIEQVKKCPIYTTHNNQVSANWQSLGVTNK